jgi:hypothetical protein
VQGFDLATKPAQFFILLGGEPLALSSVYLLLSYPVTQRFWRDIDLSCYFRDGIILLETAGSPHGETRVDTLGLLVAPLPSPRTAVTKFPTVHGSEASPLPLSTRRFVKCSRRRLTSPTVLSTSISGDGSTA